MERPHQDLIELVRDRREYGSSINIAENGDFAITRARWRIASYEEWAEVRDRIESTYRSGQIENAVLCGKALDAEDELEKERKREAFSRQVRLGKDDIIQRYGRRASGVYLVYRPSNRLHKIGQSVNVTSRYGNLCNEAGEILQFIHLIRSENPKPRESFLHSWYSEWKVRGEWFRLEDPQVNEFKKVQQ